MRVYVLSEHYCESCSPKHVGVSSPGRKGGDGDEEAGFGSYYDHATTRQDQG